MSATKTFLAQLRRLIADDQLDPALRQLNAFLENSPQLDEAIQQSARYQDICRQVRLGAVSQEDASVTKNQIRWGLLELLRNMERQGDFQSLSPLLDEIGRQAEKPQLREEMTRAISIVSSKKVVVGPFISAGGSISAGGNIIVGNSTVSESHTSRRLRLFLYFFVPLLAIGAAVLWFRLQEMQRPLTLKVRVENRTRNPELPEPNGTISLTYGSKTDLKTDVAAEAFFEGIPANFKNEQVRLRFEAKGFVPVDTTFLLASDVMVIPVRRNDDLASVTGFLTDEAGKPLEGVKVSLPCCSALTDEAGKFVLRIPFGQQRTRQRLDFFKEGFAQKSVTTPVIPGEAVRLGLEKN